MWGFLIFLIFLFATEVKSLRVNDEPSVQLLQEYIRIKSTTNSDLTPAVQFWKNLVANDVGTIFNTYEYTPGYPIIVIKWSGTNSSLSSIMLNSHVDVVPADEEENWTFPPFAGQISENGHIFGRGTQDTKSLSIQHFEAIRRLRAKGTQLLRDVYLTLMPDEETGGKKGMMQFVKSPEFKSMNVGAALDETGATIDDSTLFVHIYDKSIWQFRVDCHGTMAHGSLLLPVTETAVGKCINFLNQIYKFREDQYKIAEIKGIDDSAAYTSVNLNVLRSEGTAVNIIPGLVSLSFDMRLGNQVNQTDMSAQLEAWVKAAGDNITLTYIIKDESVPATRTDDTNPYWRAIKASADNMNLKVTPYVSTGATDARYLRAIGIPTFGLAPMLNTVKAPHRVNEKLSVDVFLKGIDIMENIVEKLANIPADQVSDSPNVYLVT